MHAVLPMRNFYLEDLEFCYDLLEEALYKAFLLCEYSLNAGSIALSFSGFDDLDLPNEACFERLFRAMLRFFSKIIDSETRYLKSFKIINNSSYNTNSQMMQFFKTKLNYVKK